MVLLVGARLVIPAGPFALGARAVQLDDRATQNQNQENYCMGNAEMTVVARHILPPLTRSEFDELRGAAQSLAEQLFKEKFGFDMDAWDASDTKALEKYLIHSHERTVEELETLIRNYYHSDGTGGQRPYEWLPHLSKYSSGPLDLRGVSKNWRAAAYAESERQGAEAAAEAARRKAEIEAADEDQRLQLLSFHVTRDLQSRGYSVFKAVLPTTCHLVATKNVEALSVMALRIMVRTSGKAAPGKAGVYQALVSLNPSPSVVYVPELEKPDGK